MQEESQLAADSFTIGRWGDHGCIGKQSRFTGGFG